MGKKKRFLLENRISYSIKLADEKYLLWYVIIWFVRVFFVSKLFF